MLEELGRKFADARDEIDNARESAETTYFNEDIEVARQAVKETIGVTFSNPILLSLFWGGLHLFPLSLSLFVICVFVYVSNCCCCFLFLGGGVCLCALCVRVVVCLYTYVCVCACFSV